MIIVEKVASSSIAFRFFFAMSPSPPSKIEFNDLFSISSIVRSQTCCLQYLLESLSTHAFYADAAESRAGGNREVIFLVKLLIMLHATEYGRAKEEMVYIVWFQFDLSLFKRFIYSFVIAVL